MILNFQVKPKIKLKRIKCNLNKKKLKICDLQGIFLKICDFKENLKKI